MMGPGLCSLLLSFCLALSSLQPAKSKTLPSMPQAAAVFRQRREVPAYEAEMFAYPPGEGEAPRGGAGPPSRTALGHLARLALALALGRPSGAQGGEEEESVLRRRLEREEAAYLGRLLRAWRELGLGGYEAPPRGGGPLYGMPRGSEGGEEEEEEEEEGGEEAVRYLLSRLLAELEAGGGDPGPRRARRSPGTPARDLLRVKRLRGGAGGWGRQEELLLVGQALSDGLSGRQRGRAPLPGTPRVRRSRSDAGFLPD